MNEPTIGRQAPYLPLDFSRPTDPRYFAQPFSFDVIDSDSEYDDDIAVIEGVLS